MNGIQGELQRKGFGGSGSSVWFLDEEAGAGVGGGGLGVEQVGRVAHRGARPRGGKMLWTNRMVGRCVSQSQEAEAGRHWFQGRVSHRLPGEERLFSQYKSS